MPSQSVNISQITISELNNAVLNFNRPMPSSSSCSPVLSSLSLPTSTQSRSMSAEQARELLTMSTPIPDNIYIDTNDIARKMKEWFTLRISTRSFFAVHVLGTGRNRLRKLLTVPRPFNSLKAGKELYIKMYNWLKLSEDVKKEILSVVGMNDEKSKKIAQGPEGEEEEYACPKKISRKREVSHHSETSSYSLLSPDSFLHTSITAETLNAFINKQVDYVDTKKISNLIKDWLKETQATQEWFATKILGRCRKTLNQCLNNPREWKNLTQNKGIFVTMHNWMCLTKENRHEIMRVYKAPNMNSH
ncbi:hypothetical protein GCK72_012922 [Caenorhabditis remanei]|uniref:CUT domain-containing protein n=1 Tax=Caenorhabditis remanei TaxID=31234 RepID=A0A6A5GPR7_CAERE|nr:hypothetical protein GCK72_012922 [Caenorhabditis remanei]KAF1756469.1 hypothetical protein GCK72_012922 [Caenorhabditis remanei]